MNHTFLGPGLLSCEGFSLPLAISMALTLAMASCAASMLLLCASELIVSHMLYGYYR